MLHHAGRQQWQPTLHLDGIKGFQRGISLLELNLNATRRRFITALRFSSLVSASPCVTGRQLSLVHFCQQIAAQVPRSQRTISIFIFSSKFFRRRMLSGLPSLTAVTAF